METKHWGIRQGIVLLFIILISTVLTIFVGSNISAADFKTNAESVKEVEVEGKGAGISARAHDDAIEEALRRAVEQGVGVYVNSQTLTEKFKLVNDTILAKAAGFVRTYKITKEWKDEEFTYVKIRAEVSLAELRDDEMAIKLMYDLAGQPKIMIVGTEKISGTASDSDSVQVALEEKLVDKGFAVIDKTQIEEVMARDVALNQENYEKAAALGKRYKADIVVTYKANADYLGKETISDVVFHRYQTSISARIIASDTARVLGTAEVQGSQGAGGDEAAARNSIKTASKALCDPIIDKLLRGWKKDVPPPANIELVVSNIDWNKATALYKALKKLRGVKTVIEPEINKNTAIFKITGDIKGNALAVRLSELTEFSLEVKSVSLNRVDAELK